MSIKIKPSRRGSFTSYCGGEVTQDCINKAKNSPNKSIRKKAVFAENARKWNKKKFGGIFKAEEGLDTSEIERTAKMEKLGNIIQQVPNVLNGIQGILGANSLKKSINSYDEAFKKKAKADYDTSWIQNYNKGLQEYKPLEGEGYSNIVANKYAQNYADTNTAKPLENNPYIEQLKQQFAAQQMDNIGNMVNGITSIAGSIAGNMDWNKKKKKDTFSVDNETKQLIANSNPNKWKDDLAGTYNKGETA